MKLFEEVQDDTIKKVKASLFLQEVLSKNLEEDLKGADCADVIVETNVFKQGIPGIKVSFDQHHFEIWIMK